MAKHSCTSELLTFYLYRGDKAPMYYRGANAALLLYDITNAATFDAVRGWLEGTIYFALVLSSHDLLFF